MLTSERRTPRSFTGSTAPATSIAYDKNEFVTPAAARLTEFYKTNLAAAADKLAFAS
jgi:hypothetical protein